MRTGFAVLAGVAATAIAIAAGLPPDFSRTAPETWDLWRCGPLPFPDRISPRVPEAVAGAPIEFGRGGESLAIVTPDAPTPGYDEKALEAMIRLIVAKVPRAEVIRGYTLSPQLRQRHVLILGTPQDNPLVRDLGSDIVASLATCGSGGYSLRAVDSPFARGRSVILALGADAAGAWHAAALLAYSIHPDRSRLSPLKPWPVVLPDGIYWPRFEADSQGDNENVTAPQPSIPLPPPPPVPFGVRIWGSPMPTLGSYQRLVRSLRELGVDTVAVQSGGWPDLPDAPERFRRAVEIAAHEGVYTILYVGNDLAAHRPAPLTANHRAIVLRTKDLPGLLEFHVYNQLAADLTPAERSLVEEQVRWLRSVTRKRIGMEVVWGHDAVAVPAEKARLITDLKAWGVDVLANDDAPIGGWSRRHHTEIWEPRLREAARFGLPIEAVLQAHIPFVEPTIPNAAEIRSQFWWALAGGAKGFLFESAYLFTSLSNRGLLSWDLRPLPDGRADEVRRLSAVARRLADFIANAQPAPAADPQGWGLALPSGSSVALRLYEGAAGRHFALLLNPSNEAAVHVTFPRDAKAGNVTEIAPGGALRRDNSSGWQVELAPGGGACLELSHPH